MHLNDVGAVVQASWLSIPDHFPDVVLDAFVVMPNQVHGVFFITPPDREGDDDSMICRGETSFAPNIAAHGTMVHAPATQPKIPNDPNAYPMRGDHDNRHVWGEKFFAPTENQSTDNSWVVPRGEMPSRGTSRTVGSIVRGFKVGVTKWAHQHTRIHTVWQRNYYEHIIRDQASLAAIRRYIDLNPSNWATDEDYQVD